MTRQFSSPRVLNFTVQTPEEAHNVYEKGRLRIDFDAYEVFLDDKPVHVYLREFEILRFLVRYPNRVFSRQQLIEAVWGSESATDVRTIDVHIRRLRMHIERDDANPEIILTVRGVGYKFAERNLEESPPTTAPRPAPRKRVTRL